MSIAVFIYGPTAVGKTDFANMLAMHIPCEIINIDAGQLYAPLTIGTAKPAWKEALVPHHMFDVCTDPADYSVATYRKAVASLVQDIVRRGKIPLFVGGSGFYMNSLLFPPLEHETFTADHTLVDDALLWDQLNTIDPIRATEIHPHDTYRLRRALTLYQQTNTAPSSLKPVYCPIISPLFVFLTQPTDILKHKISQRVVQMFSDGWVGEVKNLMGTPWESFLLRKKWIGYPELIAYCSAGEPKTELPFMQEAISRATWQYARKQLSYARMFIKKITSVDANVPCITIDLTSSHLELYIKQLVRTILLSQKGPCNE